MINRRGFCKKALLVAGALAIPISAMELFNPKRLLADKDDQAKVRWGFLVDTNKCVGCGFCVKACKLENEVPYDARVTRTGSSAMFSPVMDSRI
jgi:ferredoxin